PARRPRPLRPARGGGRRGPPPRQGPGRGRRRHGPLRGGHRGGRSRRGPLLVTDLERPATRAKGHWDRSIVALLLATFCTSSAHLAGVTALGKQVYDLTGRELDLGLLGLAEFAPAALLVLVTGTVADRFDRRRVAAIGSLAEGACALGLAVYVAGNPDSVGPIFVLVVLTGTGR